MIGQQAGSRRVGSQPNLDEGEQVRVESQAEAQRALIALRFQNDRHGVRGSARDGRVRHHQASCDQSAGPLRFRGRCQTAGRRAIAHQHSGVQTRRVTSGLHPVRDRNRAAAVATGPGRTIGPRKLTGIRDRRETGVKKSDLHVVRHTVRAVRVAARHHVALVTGTGDAGVHHHGETLRRTQGRRATVGRRQCDQIRARSLGHRRRPSEQSRSIHRGADRGHGQGIRHGLRWLICIGHRRLHTRLRVGVGALVRNGGQNGSKVHFIDRNRETLAVRVGRSSVVRDADGDGIETRSVNFRGLPSEEARRRVDLRPLGGTGHGEGQRLRRQVGICGEVVEGDVGPFVDHAIDRLAQHGRIGVGRNDIVGARCGRRHTVVTARHVAIRVAALADIVDLGAEDSRVHLHQRGAVETQVVPGFGNLEVRMQGVPDEVRVRRSGAIGPAHQEAERGDGDAVGDAPLVFVREIVGQIITREIHGRSAEVVELKPVFKSSGERIDQRRGVARHPLIDDHGRGRRIVGAAGRRVVEHLPGEKLAVRRIPIRLVVVQVRVVDVVENLVGAGKHDGAVRAVQLEGSMEHRAGGELRTAIHENDSELARQNDGVAGEGPRAQVGVALREGESAQLEVGRAVVVDLNPRHVGAGVVEQRAGVVRLDLVDPKQRVGIHRTHNGVGHARRGESRASVDGLLGSTAAEPHREVHVGGGWFVPQTHGAGG